MLGTFKQKSYSRQGGRFYHEPTLLEVEAEAPRLCDSWWVWQDFDPGQPDWRACVPVSHPRLPGGGSVTWGQRADLPWLLGLGLYALLEE